MSRPRRVAAAALTGSALVITLLADIPDPSSSAATERAEQAAARIAGPQGVRSVIAVSIDGLHPKAVRQLGAEGVPYLHRLRRWGTSTLNARTSVKRTETLPNHTGMVTGRNIDRRWRGHGVEHNTDRPGTVQRFAGHGVASVFSVVRRHGGASGLYVSKDKLLLFKRSWWRAIPEAVLHEDNEQLVDAAVADLLDQQRAFRLVHLSAPDATGHRHGWFSPEYLDAVRRTDALLGRIVDAVADTDELRRTTALIVTADHGGANTGHGDAARLTNHRIPFIVWGQGVARGKNLYRVNPELRFPGKRRPGWRARRQPVRNTDVANLALDLLGLPAVKGSRANRGQRLDWR